MRRLCVLLAGAVLTLSACGTRIVQIAGDASVPAPAPISPEGTRSDSVPQATGLPSAAAVAGKASSPDPLSLQPGPGARNTMPLAVTVSPACGTPGREMKATAVTLAGANLGFAVAYPDNSLPDFTYVPAEGNPTGTFTWTWVIRPNVRAGDAFVSVVASKGRRGASYNAPFRIAASC